MANQYIICGDAITSMKEMINKGLQVDCIITDSPYKVTSMGCNGTMSGMLKRVRETNGQLFKIPNIEDWMPLCYQLLKEKTHFYCMCNQINLFHYMDVAQKCGFKFIKSLIWDKHQKISGRWYMAQYEYILFFRKGKCRPINNPSYSDILTVPVKKLKDKKGINLHDTEKPVELMKILVENSTNENELVLDPFVGIGGIGVACKELNRNFIGIEIEQKYCDIAKERILQNEKQ